MKTDIRFFKQDGKWYADIPNHTLEENEMVMGSDTALDFLSDGIDQVILTVTDQYVPDYLLHFQRKEHDWDGAYYVVHGRTEILNEIWICNVTHDVFGEHPEDIYILDIKTE